MTRASLFSAAVLVAFAFAAAPDAGAVTYGRPDCTDNNTNFECQHPNSVSLSGFRPAPGSTTPGISSIRCSGSLLELGDERMLILTAGHCAAAWLAGLQAGTLVDVGVSFDAEINRDLGPEFPTAWSPKQYILGGQPVLPREYGPHGLNSSNIQFDYAVVVFEVPLGGFETQGATPVDPSAIPPVELPDKDFLVGKVSAKSPLPLTAVGYGTGEAHNKPGEGGNAGGAVNRTDKLGVRWTTDLTDAFSFMGPEQNLLLGSQNPARGNEGTCGGDSGGPLFYDDNGRELQVGITSSGDAICRATSIIARTDGARAQKFLSCALWEQSVAGVATCGCTEVDSKGTCPAN